MMATIEIVQGEGKDQKLQRILSRRMGFPGEVEGQVRFILDQVRHRGDEALVEFTRKYDGVTLRADELRVSEAEFNQAYGEVAPDLLEAMREALGNITRFHQRQGLDPWFFDEGEGVLLGQRVSPLERVGLYIPGGKAVYPSTVLMGAIPAQVAGVERLVMVTPPGQGGKLPPTVLVAAREVGIKEVYRVGGAQAIGALAYGTQTIPRVDKIVGPGNIYVATAKRLVYGLVDVDLVAGPSEVVILADGGGNPAYIAADILAQAEHDEQALAILITPEGELALQVKEEVERQSQGLNRAPIVERSLAHYGTIIVVKDLKEGIDLVNWIAPEHLELMVADPWAILEEIKNAGTVFLGLYSPVALGDYFAGPNHILPTGGTARFYSPLGVHDFVKRTGVVFYTRERLQQVKGQVVKLARAEGLAGHAQSIEVRDER